MSYDMSIGAESFNYTWNVAPMWYAAIPVVGIRAIYGLSGSTALEPLRHIRQYMEDNREALLPLNPSNGWGDYEGALEFINRLILASIKNPHEKWEGD